MTPSCRFCGTQPLADFVDLGATPLANSYVTQEMIAKGLDQSYPLHVRVCPSCYLVQADAPVSPHAIFSDYAYFSSWSDSWVDHARRYAQAMIPRLALTPESLVAEIASNDGYLLQHFKAAGIPVLGVEPAANVAEVAREKGITTDVAFFGTQTARRLADGGARADLIAANNVLAHVPDIRDFVAGFAELLKPQGVATFEFPHVLQLIREIQFDTIYHEHFSYLSLVTVERVLDGAGLRAFDVAELPTHGGSLRVFVCHADAAHAETGALRALRAKERDAKLDRLEGYAGFARAVETVKASFLDFMGRARRDGKTVAAYGAAAKGNTFLNVCGVHAPDIVCVFDRSTAKQGRLLPGSHVPILAPDALSQVRPDYLVILPWNLRDEIVSLMSGLRTWGGQFVTALPQTQVF
jgi:ubiquinone/menaquinone biosynthesis C-methylase UbiE